MAKTGNAANVEFMYEAANEQPDTGKQSNDNVAAAAKEADTAAEKIKANAKAAANGAEVLSEARIWVYIGPSIRGIVTNGSIHRGARDEVLNELAVGIEKFPKIERFIVADRDLAKARERLRSGKGSLSVEYDALVRDIAEKSKEGA